MTATQQEHTGSSLSARHELPTHLQVEDRLIAGLTVRQTLLLAAGLSVSYSLWRHLAGVQLSIQAALTPAHIAGLTALLVMAVRLALAALPAGAFALVALARPADRPLEEWLVIVLRYMTLPKTLVWRSAATVGADGQQACQTVAGHPSIVPHGLTRRSSVSVDPGDDDDDDDDEPVPDLDLGDDGVMASAIEKGGRQT